MGETQKIEARIKMDVIINNTKGAPVMGIEPIELIETIDVIINNTKGIPVIGIEITITVVAIKTTKTTRHKKHMTSIQLFYLPQQPMIGIEQRMEELLWRMKRL